MQNMNFRKGYDLNLSGIPSMEVEILQKPIKTGVLPQNIPFVVPRLRVEKGDRVKIGTPLFEDKKDPSLVFLSPGCGVVSDITYGKKRTIQEITVDLDQDETSVEFEKTDIKTLEKMDRKDIVSRLLKGGVWPFLRELPFRNIAGRNTPPSSIIVILDGLDKFSASPSVYLENKEDLFLYGLSVMKRLSEKVYVVKSGDTGTLPEHVKRKVTHGVAGPYPSQDPGVFLYRIKKSQNENRAFYIDGQNLVLLAELLRDGVYPVWRTVTAGGPESPQKKHARVRTGSPVSSVVNNIDSSVRVVLGNVMNGKTVQSDSFIGYFTSGITLLKEGDEEDFLGFVRPGFDRPSVTRTFLSVFNAGPFSLTCNMRGDLRPCINCGTCASLCPVDILPQFTFKCLLAGEVEEGLSHGLLDCVECSLCTYACPSKIDVCGVLKKAKADYYKERV